MMWTAIISMVKDNRIRSIGTWNIWSLIIKLMRIIEAMIRRRINIICLQELNE